MGQAIPAFVINLDRRPDRMARMGAHLDDRGVAFTRIAACDAASAAPEALDAAVSARGPLGRLGDGDRACTVSHRRAWASFLETGAAHGLVLEDDVWLAPDIAACLAEDGWVAGGLVKLEKYGGGPSRLLLGPPRGATPSGRALRPLLSRHVGGGAYVMSRALARAALAAPLPMRVPVDHWLFNANVSGFARRHPALIVAPAMATQRAWAYNSDIAALGKAAAPRGLARRWRSLKRAWFEANRAPVQALALASGRARMESVAYAETPGE